MSDLWIPLSQGYFAVIDSDDWDLVKGGKWSARVTKSGAVYATRKVAGSPGSGKGQKFEQMHRRILGVTDPRVLVDHRDGNSLNNRRGNLREATPLMNRRNLGDDTAAGKSGILGVYETNGRKGSTWRALITFDGKLQYLGTFKTQEEAIRARLRAEVELWGPQPRRQHLYDQYGIAKAS